MSINTSTNLGGSVPGSFNAGIANHNGLGSGMWQSWQSTPQTQAQIGFSQGIGGLSFHNSGNTFECPICKGPTWAMGRVCEHCKTNVSRWRNMPLSIFGLNFSDMCMLKTQLNELKRQEKAGCLSSHESGLPVPSPANRMVVKGFRR